MTLRINVTGAGTIDSCIEWESTAIVCAGGRFAFSMPASDPAAAWIVSLAEVYCYWDADLVAAGIVDDYEVVDGVLRVSGGDMSRQLALKTFSYARTATIDTTLNTYVGPALPAGWTLINQVSGGSVAVAISCLRDSLLAFLVVFCEAAGLWFVVDGKTVTVTDQLGAITHGLTPVRLSRTIDSYNVVNRIYPYGAGDGLAALSLKACTLSMPAGYSKTSEYINYDNSPYPLREKRVDFKEVTPLANSSSGVVDAANTLALAALKYLIANGSPIVQYAAEVAYTKRVRPLDQIRLAYRDDALTTNETLAATQVVTRATPKELVTVGLTLEKTARRPQSDEEIIAGAIRAARVAPVYSQLTPGWDTQAASARISWVAGHQTMGSVYFPYGQGVTQLKSVTLLRRTRRVTSEKGVQWPEPDGLQYAFAASGPWNTLPESLDLTGTLVSSTTETPLSDSVTVYVRGFLNNNFIDSGHGATPPLPAYGTGTVLLASRTYSQMYSGYAATLYNSGTVAPDDNTVVVVIPIGELVEITGSTWTYSAHSYVGSPVRDYYLPATYRGYSGYLWILRAIQSGSGPDYDWMVDKVEMLDDVIFQLDVDFQLIQRQVVSSVVV